MDFGEAFAGGSRALARQAIGNPPKIASEACSVGAANLRELYIPPQDRFPATPRRAMQTQSRIIERH